ncbi:5981_t:CDS:2, partial [Gigaspora rosea]
MKLQRISLVAALCLVASVVASPVPKEEKRVAKPHHDKRAPKHTKRNALGKRGKSSYKKRDAAPKPLNKRGDKRG